MPGARRSRAEWEDIVWRFERTGMSHEAFCDAEDLNVGTFRTWLYKLRQEMARPEPCFVEVVSSKEDSGDGCMVRFGKAEAHFAHAPEPSYLGALLRVLGGEPQ